MKELRYKLIGSYTLGEGQVLTCDRCGKAIKNVYIVLDSLTKEKKYVGSTCIDKVLTLENISKKKALIKEIVKTGELISKVREDIKISVIDIYNNIIEKEDYKTAYNLNTNKTGGYTRWEVYHSVIKNRWYSLSDVIKAKENLNKITKEIDYNIDDIEKEFKIIDTELDIIGYGNKNKILPSMLEQEIAYKEQENKIIKKIQEEQDIFNKYFVGQEKERVILELKVCNIEIISGYYGDSYLYSFITTNDNKKVFWKSSKNMNINKGETVYLKGTIKENNKSTNTTILTRCKIA